MRGIQRLGLASLTVTLCMFNVGCERHKASEQYILVATNIKLSYWQTAHTGLDRAAAAYGVKGDLRGPDSFDPQGEVQEFRNAVASRPAGILVSVADATLMQPEIDRALASGVPVVTIDSDAPNSQRLFFIGTNNLQAGRLGGDRLVKRMSGHGNVVFFTIGGQPNVAERLKGYKDVIADHPAIKVVDVFDMQGDSGKAMDKATEYLAKTGGDQVDAFVCLEASAGKDVAEAFKRANATNRLLIAMDTDEATLNLVKEGVIDSTIAQKPFTMAYYGLKALDEVHHYPVKDMTRNYTGDLFSPFPTFVDTGTALVDRTNVDFFLNAEKEAQGK
jgi:ribose transport system substrate-binding protein